WPTQFFLAAIASGRPADLRDVAVQLPGLLVGPVAAGIYAARNGAGYLSILGIGVALAVPSTVAQLALTRAAVATRPDDELLRASIVVGWFLLGLRVAAWPLAAAFAHGFLTPAEPSPTLHADT
ncbi:MAG: hypothetical protein AABZ26_06905, partial [Chloroflexota bacterium]